MRTALFSVIGRSRVLKGVAAVFAVVILGAVGSGFWELALGPLFDSLGTAMLKATSWAFGSFADVMYRRVSRDPYLNFARLPYALFVAFIIIVCWAIPIFQLLISSEEEASLIEPSEDDWKKEREETLAFRNRVKRRANFFFFPSAVFITLLYLSSFYQDAHSVRAAIFVERSIAILAPDLDPTETLRLKASFRSIETADDFYKLEDQLRLMASTEGVTLPEFESIR